jgi:hypothetical protein
VKSYLDTNQIFKQLKSAFEPMNSSVNESPNKGKSFSSTMGAIPKRPGSTKPLEPIQEENALVSAGIDLDNSKARSKKIEQLLNKVKKVTTGGAENSKPDKPLLALPSSSSSSQFKTK